jgi:hypothetical protein
MKTEAQKSYDLNKDGEITQEEIDKVRAMKEFENQDLRADSQRNMAWFSLGGMLVYPIFIVLCDAYGLEGSVKALSAMAPTYFGSVALIVSAFYGTEAYKKHKVK